jgi:hypothetical protein
MAQVEQVIDISKGNYWEARLFLYKQVGSPSMWAGGENTIEISYDGGITLRDRREYSAQKDFTIYEIVFDKKFGNKKLLNKLLEVVGVN